MADEDTHDQGRTNDAQPKSMGAAAGAHYAPDNTHMNTNSPQNPNAARGGKQEDQLSGETQKGAHNNEMRGANPQGNRPDQNQPAHEKGDKY